MPWLLNPANLFLPLTFAGLLFLCPIVGQDRGPVKTPGAAHPLTNFYRPKTFRRSTFPLKPFRPFARFDRLPGLQKIEINDTLLLF